MSLMTNPRTSNKAVFSNSNLERSRVSLWLLHLPKPHFFQDQTRANINAFHFFLTPQEKEKTEDLERLLNDYATLGRALRKEESTG